MAEHFLGLDFDGGSIKAVLVTRNMRGTCRITDFTQVPFQQGRSVDSHLQVIFEKITFDRKSCIVSVPSHELLLRRVRLPFTDKMKIQQALPFELEPLIPHPVDEVAISSSITAGQKGADILALLIPKKVLADRVALVKKYVRNIAAIAPGGLAVLSVLLNAKAIKEPIILLETGIRTMNCFIAEGGCLVDIRCFQSGENPVDGNSFCEDLEKTVEILTLNGRLLKRPSRFFVTGEGTFPPGMEKAISRMFALYPEPVDVAAIEGVTMEYELQKKWQAPIMNQALSLAMSSLRKGDKVQFHDVVASVGETAGISRRRMFAIGIVSAFFMTLAGADYYLAYRFNELKLDNLKKDINRVFHQTCPDVTRVVDPVNQLKAKTAEIKKTILYKNEGYPRHSVLDALKQISVFIAPSVEFIIRSFQYENGGILITGETKSFDSVETIKRSLLQSGQFATVTVGNSRQSKTSGHLEFEMRLSLKDTL